MQAVVLAGGQGTRLYPLTLHTPKPMLPVAGRPLLGYLVDHLAAQGVDEVFITTQYLAAAVRHFFEAHPAGVEVTVVMESEVRGTAGAVADLAPALASPFLVVSGDAVLSLDLDALLNAHRQAGGPATLCVMAPGERLRFGIVDRRGGLVAAFTEKPRLDELAPGLALNSGTYLLDREALEGVARHGPVDFAGDVFPRLLQDGRRIGAAAALRFWRDIGTAESFRDAHFEALTGAWPWAAPAAGAPAHIAPDARIQGPVAFGPGVAIGARCTVIGPTYLAAGVRLGPRTEVIRSVLLDRSRTVADVSLREAVIDADVVVPPRLALGGAILGRLSREPEPRSAAVHGGVRSA